MHVCAGGRGAWKSINNWISRIDSRSDRAKCHQEKIKQGREIGSIRFLENIKQGVQVILFEEMTFELRPEVRERAGSV